MEETYIQVAIVGAVKAPGPYQVKASQPVSEIIALAGGFDASAIVTKVQILRGTQSTLVTSISELDILMEDGDVIYVPGKKSQP